MNPSDSELKDPTAATIAAFDVNNSRTLNNRVRNGKSYLDSIVTIVNAFK